MTSLRGLYSYDLPERAIDLLGKALALQYGDGVVALEVVPFDSIRFKSRSESTSSDLVAFVVTSELVGKCDERITNSPTFIEYTTLPALVKHFHSFGVEVQLEDERVPLSPVSPADQMDVSSNVEVTLKAQREMISRLEGVIADYELEGFKSPDMAPEIGALNVRVRELQAQNGDLQARLDEALTLASSRATEVAQYSDRILQLSKDSEETRRKLEVFEGTSDLPGEALDLRRKLSNLESYPLARVHMFAGASTILQVPMDRVPGSFSDTHFVYSGSDGSLKSAYRVLQRICSEVSHNSNSDVVVLDLSTETSIDYVFHIQSLVEGISWLSQPTSPVEEYLSATPMSHVKVLSPGLTYFNDAFLMGVDWTTVFSRLRKDFQHIVVFVGSLSSLVNRILCNSFSNISPPIIVTDGLVTNLRAVLLNLSGLTATNPKVFIKSFNPKDPSLYQYLCQHYETIRVDDHTGSLLQGK